MTKDYDRETRSIVHQTQEKINKIEDNLRQELTKEIDKTNDLKHQIQLFKVFFRIIGISIILFDVVKDYLYENTHLHFHYGFGWQQWLLILLGFGVLFVGVYKKGTGK